MSTDMTRFGSDLTRIERERKREADRLRMADLARRLRQLADGQSVSLRRGPAGAPDGSG